MLRSAEPRRVWGRDFELSPMGRPDDVPMKPLEFEDKDDFVDAASLKFDVEFDFTNKSGVLGSEFSFVFASKLV